MADHHQRGASGRGGRGRLLSRLQFWATPGGDGVDAADHLHRWTNSSSFFAKAEQAAAARDHVCRPVLLGHHKDDSSPRRAGNAYRVETSYMPAADQLVDRGRSPAAGFHGSMAEATSTEPAVITAGGWTRPSRAGWSMPPHVPLEKATYMGSAAAAAEFPVTESPSYASKPNKMSSFVAVIDSREAAKKYGGKFTW